MANAKSSDSVLQYVQKTRGVSIAIVVRLWDNWDPGWGAEGL